MLLWRFDFGAMRSIVEVRGEQLFALTLPNMETPQYSEIIPHDVLRWGSRVEFPKVY